MVDLPLPKVPLATAENPSTKLAVDTMSKTRYDNPGIGPGLQALGQGIDDLSVSMAEAAGKQDAAKAITLDENGNVKVATPENNLILGRAGKAYQHAVEAGMQSGLANQVAARMTELRNEFRDNPEGFKAAAEKYATTLREKYPGVLGVDAFQRATSAAMQHWASLSNEKAHRDVQVGLQGVTTQVDDLQNKMRAMARQNGVDTPDFAKASAELNAHYDNLGKNPLWGYSKEKIDSEKRRADETFRAEAVVGDVDRNFTKRGRADAQAQLEKSILNNPDLHLSDSERSKLYSWGMARLQYLTGEQKAQIEAFKDTRDTAIDGYRTGKINDAAFDQIIERGRAIGDAEGVNKMIAARTVWQSLRGLSVLPPGQAAATVMAVPSEKSAIDKMVSLGWSPAQAAGLIGNFVHESGGKLNPNAVNPKDGRDGSDSIGIGQWNGTRAVALKSYAASKGKPWNDIETQLEFAHRELQSSEISAGTALKAATTPEAAAAAALSYERPLGWQPGGNPAMAHGWSQRLAHVRRLAGGGASANGIPFTPAQIKENPYLLSEYVHRIAADGQNQIAAARYTGGAIETGLKAGLAPDPTNLAMFMQIAQRNPETFGEQSQRILTQIKGMDIAAAASNLPAGQGQAIIDAAMSQANGGSIFQQQSALAAKHFFDASAKELSDNPGYSAARRGWIARPPMPIDVSSPDAIAHSMAERDVMATAVGAHTGDRSQSALQPQDIDQVRSIMANGSIDQKGMLIGAMNRLSEPVLKATLAKLASDKELAPLAMAAAIARDNPDATKAILEGQALLRAEPKLGANKDLSELQFAKTLPIADLKMPEVRDNFRTAINAVYASLSAKDNDLSDSFKKDRYEKAVTMVTGGVASFRGGKVLAPWYGATETQFHDAMRNLTENDLRGAVTAGGEAFPARMLTQHTVGQALFGGAYKLESAGNGKYRIYAGDGDARRYVMRDVTDRADALSMPKPGDRVFILDLTRFKPERQDGITMPSLAGGPPAADMLTKDQILGVTPPLSDKAKPIPISREMGS